MNYWQELTAVGPQSAGNGSKELKVVSFPWWISIWGADFTVCEPFSRDVGREGAYGNGQWKLRGKTRVAKVYVTRFNFQIQLLRWIMTFSPFKKWRHWGLRSQTGKWQSSSSKSMIFANIQVPTTTSIYPSSDGWIAKLLGKAAEERDGLGKGYILSKMKHASFFLSLSFNTSWLIFAHTLIDWSFTLPFLV